MKKSSKKLIVALLCAAAAVLIGLVAYDGIKQSREFSSSSAMMNTAGHRGKRREKGRQGGF